MQKGSPAMQSISYPQRLALLLSALVLVALGAACTPQEVRWYTEVATPEEQALVDPHIPGIIAQRQAAVKQAEDLARWNAAIAARRPIDCYSAMRQVWPSSTWGWAEGIIHRESRNNPAAQNPASSAAGCWQTLQLHRGRYSKLGYSWERDRYNALANTRVAYDLYLEAGTSPWRVR